MPDEKPTLTVWAHQTFHLSGESEKYVVGRFTECPTALEACRRVVDEFLEQASRECSTAQELLARFDAAGPDPFVEPRSAGCVFAARRYAAERARQLAGG